MRRAFTLLEMLVVIAVIATLASVVAPMVFRNVSDAKVSAAKSQLDIFALALEQYRMDTNSYPSTTEGLTALRVAPNVRSRALGSPTWRGPYLRKAVPLDPWGRAYQYVSPGKANPESYDLSSLGRDGALGGEGEDADLTSWGASSR
jgi:general secretion pathway protein G